MSKLKYEPRYDHIRGNLLTFESWLWMQNRKKRIRDSLVIFEEIREIDGDFLEGDIDNIIKYWQEELISLKEDYPQYENFLVEKVSFHLGCGDYDRKIFLVGKRMESKTEIKKRIALIKKEKKEKLREEENANKKKEDKEYQKFLKLKAKYEPMTREERTLEMNRRIKELFKEKK